MDYIKYIRDKVGKDPINLTGVNIIIIDDEERVLLQRRGHFPLKWGLLGGITELGEMLEDTAKREVFEETGLRIEKLKLLGTTSGNDCYIELPNGDRAFFITIAYYTHNYYGRLFIDGDETKDLKFFSYSELPDLIPSTHRRMIDLYYSNNEKF